LVTKKLKDENYLRRLTSTIVAGESLLLFFAALFLVVESFIAEVKNYDALLGEIFFAILGGLGLLMAARGIRRGKRYGNSPSLLANLIAIAVAYYIWEGGWPGIALMLGFFALLAIIGILMITALSAHVRED
jgi:peptidoglycan/LPS O-acetylase OafA/YrhL